MSITKRLSFWCKERNERLDKNNGENVGVCCWGFACNTKLRPVIMQQPSCSFNINTSENFEGVKKNNCSSSRDLSMDQGLPNSICNTYS
jgi:hypothetical protein